FFYDSFFVSRFLCLPPCPLFPYTTLFRSIFSNMAACAAVALLLTLAAAGTAGAQLKVERVFGPEVKTGPYKHPAAIEEFDNGDLDRKSTRLNSSHVKISYAVFCLKKKKYH